MLKSERNKDDDAYNINIVFKKVCDSFVVVTPSNYVFGMSITYIKRW